MSDTGRWGPAAYSISSFSLSFIFLIFSGGVGHGLKPAHVKLEVGSRNIPMVAHCPCPQSVVSVSRAGEAAVEEGGYGAVSAAQRPAGSALGRFVRCCAVLAVATFAFAALSGAYRDTEPAGLAATWGYAGTGAHTLAMLRQRDIGSLLDHAHQLQLEAAATTEDQLQLMAAATTEAASSPASVAESAEPSEADSDPGLKAMGVEDVPIPKLQPRALHNGVEPDQIALYPDEVDADANGEQADLDIIHDEEQDEMDDPPPGYQGMISMNVCATHSPAETQGEHWCLPAAHMLWSARIAP